MMVDFSADRLAHLQRALLAHFKGEVRFDEPSRKLYSTDASIYQVLPLGVLVPRDEEDFITAVQIALETHTPITSRGGGTSLSGQSIGPGLVLDCSKYLHQIGPVDVEGRRVTVQPGVVLDQLNRHLAASGLMFGPEVATASRATLGGMIGNNSAGARSILYGQTVHHVRGLKVVLADGHVTDAKPLTPVEWDCAPGRRGLEGECYRTLQRIVTEHRDEIDARFPKILRRVSGYNLAAYVEARSGTDPERAKLREFLRTKTLVPPAALRTPNSLLPLLVGSEGTLAATVTAELNLVPRPKHRALLVPHFDSLTAALDALAVCLEFQPSAVELVDAMLLNLARTQRSLKGVMAAIVGEPEALFMVEFVSDDPREAADRVERLQRRLQEVTGVTATVAATEPALRDPLWAMRSAAVPLLYGMPGDRKPVTFVEDCAVAPARLPEFTARFRELIQRHGTDGAFYGHASVGCLHIRPVLNLKDPDDVARMRRITQDVTSLVLDFGGSLSGEHGDGFARSEWNQKMFGPTVYGCFQQIKRAFDPHNLFNPGKIVDAPPMTENLRYGPAYKPIELPLVLDYSGQQGFFRSIELCNGSGVCRKTQGGAMCPSFRATLEEADSTRGRANALRLAISDPANASLKKPTQALGHRWLHDVMDLCLSCKACKSECPSNVDVAKLKAEFLHAYHQEHRRPLLHRMVKNLDRANRWGAPFAPLVNWFGRRGLLRWGMEKLTGLDRRRPLPTLHRDHLRRWFAKRPVKETGQRVVLFDDCFTTFHEPHIGQAAIEVLETAGYRVGLTRGLCCGRSLISKGYLDEAKAFVATQLPTLSALIADGTPILGLEPSCVTAMIDEWPELLPGEATKQFAQRVHLADVWLHEQITQGKATLPLMAESRPCVLHGHCHQKALLGVRGTTDALKLIPALQVTTLDAGCCGMAGAFGYEHDHYDISVKIAGLELLPALSANPDATVVATGTSCRHQIRDLTGRTARHPLEVLQASLFREI